MAFVYKITSPKNRIYIGSTSSKDVRTRWNRYFSHDCKTQKKLYRSILKYGAINHKFEILWEGFNEEMLEKERYFGELFDALSPQNLNIRLPKLGEVYGGMSDEAKLNHTKRIKEFWNNQENKERFSYKRKGMVYSDKAKENMKLGQAKRYENRKVVCFNENNEIIEEFQYLKDASIKYDVPSSSICIAIKKNTKSAGFYWKYIITDSYKED